MNDPLITAALLGSARAPELPPAPDPGLEELWSRIPTGNPAGALLHGLALSRCMLRAGAKPVKGSGESKVTPCPPEGRETLSPAAVDLTRRLVSGEYAEIFPEWLDMAVAVGRILPARVLPEFLAAATKNPAMRATAPALVGERGFWIARRHPQFSWLLESGVAEAGAWEEGSPAERLTWFRLKREEDPELCASVIAAGWKDEDAAMRESILRLIVRSPLACDEEWLENQAMKDRRQENRELASCALMGLRDSGFRARALNRAGRFVRKGAGCLQVDPPEVFDPLWVGDGIREKPPQGTGEKAWWLRQIIAMVPIEDWSDVLGIDAERMFSMRVEDDWRDALVMGWLDSGRLQPQRAVAEKFLPFVTALETWPSNVISKGLFIASLLESMEVARRVRVLDGLVKDLPHELALDLIVRCGAVISRGEGLAILATIETAIFQRSGHLIRPQARALAACVPPEEIDALLLGISKLPEVDAAVEAFATTLEFRRSMISQLSTP